MTKKAATNLYFTPTTFREFAHALQLSWDSALYEHERKPLFDKAISMIVSDADVLIHTVSPAELAVRRKQRS